MKDEQLFREKFREIANNLSYRYSQDVDSMRNVNNVCIEIINELDRDDDALDNDYLITKYKKSLHDAIDYAPAESYGVGDKLYYKFCVRAYKFTIEYLEGLKNNPVEISEVGISDILKGKNVFLKGQPMELVYSHFKVFTEAKSKNGRPFLSEGQLAMFLKRGFLGDLSIPKQTFNHEGREKGFLIKRFREYFDICVCDFSEPSDMKRYIDLVFDCFDNWDRESIRHNFKKDIIKKKW